MNAITVVISARRITREPLTSMPITDESFRRIKMDIVGPINLTSSGNNFNLTFIGYATRYPEAEAIPLRSINNTNAG